MVVGCSTSASEDRHFGSSKSYLQVEKKIFLDRLLRLFPVATFRALENVINAQVDILERGTMKQALLLAGATVYQDSERGFHESDDFII